jgi:hypothetical protein
MLRRAALTVALLLPLAAHAQTPIGTYGIYKSATSAPTPPAGQINQYFNSSDGHWHQKTSAGTDTVLDVGSGGGGGSVTSVAMSVPAIMSVAGSPVTTTGTLAVTLATETANTVWCGPTSGGAATPTFRALVAADLPSLSSVYLPLSGGTMSSGADIVSAGGVGDLDFSASSGVTRTGTGAVTVNGNASVVNGKTLTCNADNLGVTFTQADTALWIKNNTAAAAGVGQYSPLIDLSAAGWATSGGTSVVEHMALQNQVFQGAAPTYALTFMRSSGTTDYVDLMSLSNTGDLVWPARPQGSIDLSAATSGHGGITSGAGGIAANGPLTVNSPQVFTVSADNVGTTQAARAIFANGLPATTGNQKFSPVVEIRAQGFSNDIAGPSGVNSVPVRWGLQTRPVEFINVEPRGELVLWSSIDNVAYAEKFHFTSDAAMSFSSGAGAGVSGSNKGKLIYNDSTQTWQESHRGSAYANLGSSTLASAYAAGASSSDSTMTLGVTAGEPILKYNAVGTAQTAGLTLSNATAASTGAQQYSPALTLQGGHFGSGSNHSVAWTLQAQSGADGTDEGRLRLYGTQGGTTTPYLDFKTDGNQTPGNGAPAIYNAAAATGIIFSSSIIADPVNGYMVGTGDMLLTVGSTSRRLAEVNARHFVPGQSAVPSSAPGTGAGTGGTCTVLAHGTDEAGILEVVSGTAPAGSDATICTTTLNTAFDNKPTCQIVGANSADALLMLTTAVYFNYAAGSTTTWVIKNASIGGISGTLDISYKCTDSSL